MRSYLKYYCVLAIVCFACTNAFPPSYPELSADVLQAEVDREPKLSGFRAEIWDYKDGYVTIIEPEKPSMAGWRIEQALAFQETWPRLRSIVESMVQTHKEVKSITWINNSDIERVAQNDAQRMAVCMESIYAAKKAYPEDEKDIEKSCDNLKINKMISWEVEIRENKKGYVITTRYKNSPSQFVYDSAVGSVYSTPVSLGD